MPGNGSSLKSSALKRRKDVASDASNSAAVHVVKKRRVYEDHSYTDFSKLTPDLEYSKKTKLADMTFVERIHHVLSKKEFQSCIAWKSHGRAFCILVPKTFEKQVCAEYFAMPPRYSTFLRQLNNHRFKHISQGPDRNCYYNECFLRGMPWLCKYMPKPKNARLLIPDPENEPDFYTLSKVSPLPDQAQDESASPSVPKKHSSSTKWGQSRPSPTKDATRFACAEAASDVAGQPKTALQHPTISTAALGAPFNTAILPPPNISLTSTPLSDQLLLMQTSAHKEEQDRFYKMPHNAMHYRVASPETMGA
ncbi:DNA binding protein [Fragilaria crotonensis]|nr:DNA binding protein [Fragilaria crotonensis]